MTINRKVFFDSIRSTVFGGSMSQTSVDGINAILDEWERRKMTDLRWLAYMLSTARGEVGVNMQPVREGFCKTDAEARAYVTKQGYPYSVEINGQVFYGRGLVQLTWDTNYKAMGEILKIDLYNHPDKALNPGTASAIMFEGMARGTFTGKKLADYFNKTITDWYNARRIVNGTDKASQFAKWGEQFYAALKAATAKPVSGPVAGAVIAGSAGAIVVQQTAQHMSTSNIVFVCILVAIVAGAVFLVLRNWRDK